MDPARCPACDGADVRATSLVSEERYRLFRCRGCGSQFFRDEGPEFAAVDEEPYWEAYKFDLYADDAVRQAFDHRYGHMLSIADRKVGRVTSVLDVGCGIGNFLQFAKASGIRGTGVDVSKNAVAEARRRRLEAYVSTEIDSVLEDESSDALTMWDVVEHLPDPYAVLASLVPKVKHGGVLLFETPDGGFPVRRALLALQRVSKGRIDLTSPMYYWEHKIYFTDQGMIALLARLEVDVVDIRRETSVREKMSKQFAVNARKGSWKARILARAWPLLESAFRRTGHGNKLMVVAKRR